MIHVERLTAWEKQAVITFLLYRMPIEERKELMTALPTAYNKLVNADAVEITFRKSDGLPMEGLNATDDGIEHFVIRGTDAAKP